MTLLIIGGTGTLGRQIVRQAINEGYQIKCLIRNLQQSVFLRNWGTEIVYGDLSKPETIPSAFKNITVVIDAATVRSSDNYNAEKIDWEGKLALIEAAKVAKIRKFIFFSMLHITQVPKIPLLALKYRIEFELRHSNLDFTVYRCAGFFQGLIQEYAIPILEQQTIWLLGQSESICYLSTEDASQIIIKNLVNTRIEKKGVDLVGQKAWGSENIIQLCERLSGKRAKKAYIPIFILFSLQKVLRVFEWTWNISDRLEFSKIAVLKSSYDLNNLDCLSTFEYGSLEKYLQDFFGKIFRKLKEINYYSKIS